MKFHLLARATLLSVFGMLALITGCSGDETQGTTGTGGTGGMGTGGMGTGGMGTGGMGTGGSVQLAPPRFVAEFDAQMGEFPEGLAIDNAGTNAYVGFMSTGQIVKVGLSDGMVTPYGSVPQPPPMGAGFLLGLAFDSNENLYAAVASFDMNYQAGIYQIPKGGGAATLFASDPLMVLPNGIAVDKDDNLFVTDSAFATVYKIDQNKMVTKWFSDATLLGSDSTSMCASGMNIGANGITIVGDAVYVSVTDKASLVKIGINPDGTAGSASAVIAPDCGSLAGADGITRGPDGTIYVAANGQNAMLQVGSDNKAKVLSSDAIFDSPASVVYGQGQKGPALFVTNAAIVSAQMMGGTPKPALVEVPLTP